MGFEHRLYSMWHLYVYMISGICFLRITIAFVHISVLFCNDLFYHVFVFSYNHDLIVLFSFTVDIGLL